MNSAQKVYRLIAVGILLVVASGPVFAGKVNMPKEGSFTFDFCNVGEATLLTGGDKLLVSHFKNIANIHTNPPGGAFDRTSARCLGVYTNINGKQIAYGVCEVTDDDGDKFWLEFNGSEDGTGGQYTAPVGTGKYDGMTLKGQYVLDFWPAATKEFSQACNHNKGTYKLK